MSSPACAEGYDAPAQQREDSTNFMVAKVSSDLTLFYENCHSLSRPGLSSPGCSRRWGGIYSAPEVQKNQTRHENRAQAARTKEARASSEPASHRATSRVVGRTSTIVTERPGTIFEVYCTRARVFSYNTLAIKFKKLM